MVGGTKLPPQDSVSEPWWHERKTTATAKAKTFYEGKRQKPSPLYVSLDNADTVIEGGPAGARIHEEMSKLGAPSCLPLAGWGFSPLTPSVITPPCDRRPFASASTNGTIAARRGIGVPRLGPRPVPGSGRLFEISACPRRWLSPCHICMGCMTKLCHTSMQCMANRYMTCMYCMTI